MEVREENGFYYFNIRDLEYRVRVEDERLVSMRSVIKVKQDGKSFLDKLDLFSYEERSKFALNISDKFLVDIKDIEQDLMIMIEHLEQGTLN